MLRDVDRRDALIHRLYETRNLVRPDWLQFPVVVHNTTTSRAIPIKSSPSLPQHTFPVKSKRQSARRRRDA